MENNEQIYSIFRFADQVYVGDEVLVKKNDNLIAAKVISVSSLIMQGYRSIKIFVFFFLVLFKCLPIFQEI